MKKKLSKDWLCKFCKNDFGYGIEKSMIIICQDCGKGSIPQFIEKEMDRKCKK